MRDAVQGLRLVIPHIEYQEKLTLHIGERTFELLHMKNVHSEADTAIWLPNERVLFAATSRTWGATGHRPPGARSDETLLKQ